MDQCSYALFLRLVAGSVELILREGHTAALADRCGGKNLNQIRASRFLLAYELTNLIRCSGLFTFAFERLDGCKNARTWNLAFRDGVTQRDVCRRANTLYRCEARHQRAPGIRFCLIGGELCRLVS